MTISTKLLICQLLLALITPHQIIRTFYQQQNLQHLFTKIIFETLIVHDSKSINVEDPSLLMNIMTYFERLHSKEEKTKEIISTIQNLEIKHSQVIKASFEKDLKQNELKKEKLNKIIPSLVQQVHKQEIKCQSKLSKSQIFGLIIQPVQLNDNQLHNYFQLQSSLISCETRQLLFQIIQQIKTISYFSSLQAIPQHTFQEIILKFQSMIQIDFQPILNLNRNKKSSINYNIQILHSKFSFYQDLQAEFSRIMAISNFFNQLKTAKKLKFNESNLEFSEKNFLKKTKLLPAPHVKMVKKMDFLREDQKKTTKPPPYNSIFVEKQEQTLEQEFYQTLKMINDLLTGLLLIIG